jgi:hypothetical protein
MSPDRVGEVSGIGYDSEQHGITPARVAIPGRAGKADCVCGT